MTCGTRTSLGVLVFALAGGDSVIWAEGDEGPRR